MRKILAACHFLILGVAISGFLSPVFAKECPALDRLKPTGEYRAQTPNIRGTLQFVVSLKDRIILFMAVPEGEQAQTQALVFDECHNTWEEIKNPTGFHVFGSMDIAVHGGYLVAFHARPDVPLLTVYEKTKMHVGGKDSQWVTKNYKHQTGRGWILHPDSRAWVELPEVSDFPGGAYISYQKFQSNHRLVAQDVPWDSSSAQATKRWSLDFSSTRPHWKPMSSGTNLSLPEKKPDHMSVPNSFKPGASVKGFPIPAGPNIPSLGPNPIILQEATLKAAQSRKAMRSEFTLKMREFSAGEPCGKPIPNQPQCDPVGYHWFSFEGVVRRL